MYVTAAMLADKLDIDTSASKIDLQNAGKYRSARLLLPTRPNWILIQLMSSIAISYPCWNILAPAA